MANNRNKVLPMWSFLFSAGGMGTKMKHSVHLMRIRTLEKNGVEGEDGGSNGRMGLIGLPW